MLDRVATRRGVFDWSSVEEKHEEKSKYLVENFQAMSLLVDEKGEKTGKSLSINAEGKLIEASGWRLGRGTSVISLSTVLDETWSLFFECVQDDTLPPLPEGATWGELFVRAYRGIKVLQNEHALEVSLLGDTISDIEQQLKDNDKLKACLPPDFIGQRKCQRLGSEGILSEIHALLKEGVPLKTTAVVTKKNEEETPSLFKVHATFMEHIKDLPVEESLRQDWSLPPDEESLYIESKTSTKHESSDEEEWVIIKKQTEKSSSSTDTLTPYNPTKDTGLQAVLHRRNKALQQSILDLEEFDD